MITAQDIREKTFEKSKFGGYDMAEVDDFLEELADDLTNSQKETQVLKGKMKVLVEKIEEYRENESALNQSILAANKLAQQIESEARAKAEKMIADAEAQVKDTLGNITERSAYEEKRLAAAQAASAKFLEGIRAMCNAQLKNIDTLSNASLDEKPAAQAAPAKEEAEEPVRLAKAPLRRPAAPVEEIEEAEDDEPADIDSTQPFAL